ncbi:MAG TPA: CHAD domain-containing protein [Candidatus Acidoferrales bacterium]|nr:CHAD domain-containing protein [Candidatus Acidoferrales bacterium]
MPQSNPTIEKKAGLPYWMDRVLEEHSKVGSALHSDAVHDFRISLRRCILIAEIMEDLDPSCDWKAMRKMGRQTFQRVGALRDTQVLMKWIDKLGEKGEVSTEAFLGVLKKQQEVDKNDARVAIREFDRKKWRAFRRDCAKHHRHVVANRPACESILLEVWERARDLNRSAQRSRSLIAYHRLRVGLKKFRYAAENFLPSMYAGWAPDLKIVQDTLGDIHELTVLDRMLSANRGLVDEAAFSAWREKLEKERDLRLEEYRAKMSAKSSLLRTWREGLPAQKDLRSIGLARLGEWAFFATPDFSRVRRMARLSLQIYDGLANCGLTGKDPEIEERFILQAAALLQETGKFRGGKAYHKESYRMIRKISPPPGWSKTDLEHVALVSRFHRRALPYPDHAKLRVYELPLRQSLIRLAAILRMANAFHAKRFKAIRRLHVENGPGFLVIRADGFHEQDANDPKISSARRFLEFVFQGPVHILAPGTRIMMPKIVRTSARSDAA